MSFIPHTWRVMTHVWMLWLGHVTRVKESAGIQMRRHHIGSWHLDTPVSNENACVMAHIWMSHGRHMNASCHTCKWDTSVFLACVQVLEHWNTYGKMSRVWTNHVTHPHRWTQRVKKNGPLHKFFLVLACWEQVWMIKYTYIYVYAHMHIYVNTCADLRIHFLWFWREGSRYGWNIHIHIHI